MRTREELELLIQDVIDGNATDEEIREAEVAVAANPELATVNRRLLKVSSVLDQVEQREAPPELHASIMGRLSPAKTPRKRSEPVWARLQKWLTPQRGFGLAAGAAAAVLALGLWTGKISMTPDQAGQTMGAAGILDAEIIDFARERQPVWWAVLQTHRGEEHLATVLLLSVDPNQTAAQEIRVSLQFDPQELLIQSVHQDDRLLDPLILGGEAEFDAVAPGRIQVLWDAAIATPKAVKVTLTTEDVSVNHSLSMFTP